MLAMVSSISSLPPRIRSTSFVPSRKMKASAAESRTAPSLARASAVVSPDRPWFSTIAPLRPPSRNSGCMRLG